MARSMMNAKGVPKTFWAEAVATSVYLLNISPTKAVYNRTPYEAWKGNKPKVSHLRVFGCITYALINSNSRRKLDEKSVKCIFVGYSPQSKAYKLYDPLSGKVLISRDVVFNENASWDFSSGKEISGDPIPLIDDVPNGETTPPATRTNSTNSSPTNSSASTLVHTRNNSSSSNASSSSSFSDSPPLKIRTLDDIYADPHAQPYALYASDPVSYKEAVERQEWKQAMKEEMQAIERAPTWEHVDFAT
ncbi:retrovirus-related pol polyprotein from transposon TNT 1-94 [Tanacetum coccineum]